MTTERFWNQYVHPSGAWRRDPRTRSETKPPGEFLADLRAGLGQPAGSVPRLWKHYTVVVDDFAARHSMVSTEQRAEHAALALFGLHQQSQNKPMHRPAMRAGEAFRALHRSGKFSEDAVDARVAAAVASTSVSTLLRHLRGLVTQLRSIPQPLDYDRLMLDLARWESPELRRQVRSEWGFAYYAWEKNVKPATDEQPPSTGLETSQ